MSLIVGGDGVKRRLPEGAFEICGSGAELLNMIRQIETKLNGSGEDKAHLFYGWITIRPIATIDSPSGEPLPWGAA